jgi:hypothetical protein
LDGNTYTVYNHKVYKLFSEIGEDNINGICKKHDEMRNAYKDLVGKSEGKRPLRRRRSRWEDHIEKFP